MKVKGAKRKERNAMWIETLIFLTIIVTSSPIFFIDWVSAGLHNLDGTTDIVELPPDRTGDIFHLEDIDDNVLENTIPNDVPDLLQIHSVRYNEEVIVPR
ncbi:hypothetical protein NPIL_264051 [Nephila pilipes]|uniref:Uncharacterized protein n=1 Tax=Nephila pilipes TaxID=299642 RepID=A0A8X6PCW1_NEPPI|nr:hypothetical protein NPIL_264051 [Nephila pilipes]